MRALAVVAIVLGVAGIIISTFIFGQERSQADLCADRGGIPVQGDNTVTCLDPDALLGDER